MYHRLGALYDERNLFLMVLEAGKSKVRVPSESVFGEGPLPGA